MSANSKSGVDEVTKTNGIAAVSSPLGADYPSGLLIVQDDVDNIQEKGQNFKLISFQDIIRALNLNEANQSVRRPAGEAIQL